MNDFKLLINGNLIKGASALDVINPATGRTLTAAPLRNPELHIAGCAQS
jgi:hypothetical protein